MKDDLFGDLFGDPFGDPQKLQEKLTVLVDQTNKDTADSIESTRQNSFLSLFEEIKNKINSYFDGLQAHLASIDKDFKNEDIKLMLRKNYLERIDSTVGTFMTIFKEGAVSLYRSTSTIQEYESILQNLIQSRKSQIQ